MKKILLIEDNMQVRENTAEIITMAGYEVVTAANGKIGVELALTEKPDVIVCDIMMPVLDGYGVYHLLSKHLESASIPFIFLTAKSEKADLRKGMDMGADDYIMKPFDGIEILNAIEVRLKKLEALKLRYASPLSADEFQLAVGKASAGTFSSGDHDIQEYSNKQTVYHEGQSPRTLYKVVSGKVKTIRTNEEGKEFITGIINPGEYFGYTAILQGGCYKDAARALEETTLMLIPRDIFLQLIFNDKEIAGTFIKIISRNVVEKDDSMLNLAYSSVRGKVASGLMRLLEKYKIAGTGLQVISLSRENMAQSIGIATESLIRTLADFKEEKLVNVELGKVTILNETRLRNLPS